VSWGVLVIRDTNTDANRWTGNGPVWLRLTGAAGVKDFLAAQLPRA
jgi:hypothetical protein